jgi:hypothetical protein
MGFIIGYRFSACHEVDQNQIVQLYRLADHCIRFAVEWGS